MTDNARYGEMRETHRQQLRMIGRVTQLASGHGEVTNYLVFNLDYGDEEKLLDWTAQQLDAERGRVAMLEQTLRVYADPYAYKDDLPVGIPDFYTDCDFGQMAQDALQVTAADWLAGVKAEAVREVTEELMPVVGAACSAAAAWAEFENEPECYGEKMDFLWERVQTYQNTPGETYFFEQISEEAQ